MTFIKPFIILLFIVLPPIGGIYFANKDIFPYLEFPPRTIYIKHAPFSWSVFVTALFIDLIIILPLLSIIIKVIIHRGNTRRVYNKAFPWWGYLGIISGIVSWLLAWNRFPWFSRFQPYTFTPLWLSYIVVINAIKYRRDGICTITKAPVRFLALFPVSAIFWWLFEYLNRFVQNWHYVNVSDDPIEYFLHASISFSTVLPAVISTQELLLESHLVRRTCDYLSNYRVKVKRPRLWGWICILFSCMCLFFLGIFPDYLFSLIWVCPLLIIVGIQVASGEAHIFSGVVNGDWGTIISSVFSVLICGFFWEMWNFYSFAKWEYSIPFVDKFHIFEMPVLGYTGYIPFGFVCVSVVQMLKIYDKD